MILNIYVLFVLHQKLLLEEYSCDMQYANGSKESIMAITLSCLETNLVEEITCEFHFGTVHLPQKFEHTSAGQLYMTGENIMSYIYILVLSRHGQLKITTNFFECIF